MYKILLFFITITAWGQCSKYIYNPYTGNQDCVASTTLPGTTMIGPINPCVSASGSATAYTCPSTIATTCTTGLEVLWTPDIASGATPTLNVGCGAKYIKTNENASPATAQFEAGTPVRLRYDGTAWRAPAVIPSSTGGTATGTLSVGGTVSAPMADIGDSATDGRALYLFSTFNTATGTSYEGLHLLLSVDGKSFYPISSTNLFTISGGLRDPSIFRNTTDGKYYVAYTQSHSDVWTSGLTTFGIAVSADLVYWTALPDVSGFPGGTTTVMAPEWYVDTDGTVRAYVTVSPDGITTASIYETHTTAASLATGTPSWSTPAQVYDDPIHHAAIDPYMVKVGSTYYLFYKDNTGAGGQYILYATGTSALGPFTKGVTGDWAGIGSGTEGPCLVRVTATKWRMYFDREDTPGGGVFHQWYTESSDGFSSWSARAQLTSQQFSPRHGTVLRIADVSASRNAVASAANGKVGGAENLTTAALIPFVSTTLGDVTTDTMLKWDTYWRQILLSGSSGNPGFCAVNTTGGFAGCFYIDPSGGFLRIGSSNATAIELFTNNVLRLMIDASGNIIGDLPTTCTSKPSKTWAVVAGVFTVCP